MQDDGAGWGLVALLLCAGAAREFDPRMPQAAKVREALARLKQAGKP